MTATLTIDLGNAAFDGRETREVGRILRELATRLERRRVCESPVGLLDLNGNKVGEFRVTPDPK